MTDVVRLDDEDLDDEDRAILAEVSRKGYYHGRPKNAVCAPPQKIEAAAEPSFPSTGGRAAYDAFQKKWDQFDNDKFLKKLEGPANSAAAWDKGQCQVNGSPAHRTKLPPAPQPPWPPDPPRLKHTGICRLRQAIA